LGVYLSVVRALPAPPPDGLSLLAGAAVCEVLRRNFDLAAGLKWPNDVVVGGRKICGVLVELVGAGGPAPIAVVGLGLNVGQRMGDLPREDATSLLLETGLSPVPQELVNGLVAAIDHELRSAAAPGYAVRRFGEFGVHRHGEFVSCHVGERTVVGLFDGLEPSGALRLRLGDEVRVLHSGELGTGEEEPAC
jgi:BirA family biotin operon repressor/biotin-[acetyl-CoA-carboxylase] ligase